MLEGLRERLSGIFRKLRKEAIITEKNLQEALKEVRIALLEADVNFRVVKEFLEKTKEKALGEKVLKSVTPAQQFIKIVYDELVELLGGKKSDLLTSPFPPSIYMLVGIQGSGKTTTCAKLGEYLKEKGKEVLLVATDTRRPAAREQLKMLAEKLNLPYYLEGEDPLQIALNSLKLAREKGYDTVILDTQGRLHVDEELMEELKVMKEKINPTETLLVADAMTGQEAVNIASIFHQKIGIDGIILTKMDSDTRGGAALSMRMVTGCPIKFIGTGESLKDLEVFHPERIASRILGKGDVITLVEKAQTLEEDAEEMAKKIKADEFNLEDFLNYFQKMKRMGPIEKLLDYLPIEKSIREIPLDEKYYKRVEAIILSMTPEERRNPKIIDGSRKKRIARGSGTTVQEVNQLLKQFQHTKKMMKEMVKYGQIMKRKGWLPPIT
ncbi:MAG TPA: signal recognition particle protein [bacterium]|nr:signal recognition particle protein [bacterium]HEX68606.1 signal recognition particle protein [bacterium]